MSAAATSTTPPSPDLLADIRAAFSDALDAERDALTAADRALLIIEHNGMPYLARDMARAATAAADRAVGAADRVDLFADAYRLRHGNHVDEAYLSNCRAHAASVRARNVAHAVHAARRDEITTLAARDEITTARDARLKEKRKGGP